MIQVMLCHNQQTRVGGEELLEQWRKQPESWIWIDLFNEPAEQEQSLLKKWFDLPELLINEAQRDRHPPSFEVNDDFLYLLLKPLDAESKSLDFNTLQLAMFSSERFLITRHSKHSPYLEKLWNKIDQSAKVTEQPIHIMEAMSMRVAQRYGQVLLDLEQRLDVIEDELFESPSDTLMKELVGYNTGLRKMHRILTYYVNVFEGIKQELHTQANPHYEEFDGIYALIERFNSLSTLYQNVITDLIEAYISLNGHRLNQIMKVLTVVTVIFVPLTLLVGIYGMNFENMPELKNQYGYYILLMTMSGIAVTMLYIFRRMRWL